MTDHDLEQAIFLAIARNRPSKQPAAVLAAIRETHVVIERGRWERVRSFAVREFAENYTDIDAWRNERNAGVQPEDLVP